MSALLVQPAVGTAAPAHAPGRRSRPRRAAPPSRRRHLQLVGPEFVPATAPRAHVTGAAVATSPVRLTVRGRRVVAVTAFVVATALAVVVGSMVGAALNPRAAGPAAVVTVAAGDSLWGLAAEAAAPGQDVRDVVAEIVALNTLEGASVHAGQQLLVPQG